MGGSPDDALLVLGGGRFCGRDWASEGVVIGLATNSDGIDVVAGESLGPSEGF